MMKTIVISLLAAGTLGVSAGTANSPTPESGQVSEKQAIELTTGSMKIKAANDGITTSVAERADLSLTLKTKSGFRIRLRF